MHRARTDTRIVRFAAYAAIAIAVAAVVLVSGGKRHSGESACRLLPEATLVRIGVPTQPRPFVPEGDAPHATGCSYGDASGPRLTVFAIARGGAHFVRDTEKVLDAHGVATQRLHGKGYRGYTTTGPGDGSESLVVLRGDHYINVIFFNLPSGTAARFAPAAAANLG